MCPATSVPSVPQCPVPICLTDSSALVPKYLGSKMSWVRSVCTPLTRLRNDYQAHCLCVGTAISLSFHPAKLAYSQRRRHACYVTGRPYACSATCRAAPTGECDDDNRWHCVCVEVVNELAPANQTVVLNCTLPQDGNVTWFYNDKTIDLSSKNYNLEHGCLKVVAGELSFQYALFVCGNRFCFLVCNTQTHTLSSPIHVPLLLYTSSELWWLCGG